MAVWKLVVAIKSSAIISCSGFRVILIAGRNEATFAKVMVNMKFDRCIRPLERQGQSILILQ